MVKTGWDLENVVPRSGKATHASWRCDDAIMMREFEDMTVKTLELGQLCGGLDDMEWS